ncbi:hypothetical protein ACFPM7_17835 [Actinokineospora guangxiensis]|uniref:Uncharacterized protein n=1 Tax=Actinokineospora guangxiensis TaxID=1490288 RepID=A0ABW0ERW4_9PSEU
MPADFDQHGVPTPGAIITFVRSGGQQPGGTGPVGSGIVVGPVYPDPDTGRWWVGVRLPSEADELPGVDLIDAESIVDSIPPRWEKPVW